MACGVIKLSHRGRLGLALLFTILSVVAAIISFLLFLYGLYVLILVASALPSEKAVISFIFLVISMTGLQQSLYFLIGIKVNRDNFINAHKKKSRYILRMWNYVGLGIISFILIIGTMGGSISNHIVRSMHNSMERGMKRYLKNIHWKKTIDTLQFQSGCCGSRGYEDWYKIPWMKTYHLNIENEIVQNYTNIIGEDVYLDAVPWSCCSSNYLNQCIHDPIQQIQMRNLTSDATSSINTAGCIEMIRGPIELGLLIYILASYTLFCLQVSPVILGDPNGIAPGWMLGRNNYNYTDRSNILALMTIPKNVKPPLTLTPSKKSMTSTPRASKASQNVATQKPSKKANPLTNLAKKVPSENLHKAKQKKKHRETSSSASDYKDNLSSDNEHFPLLK